jgi:hypothetical protein
MNMKFMGILLKEGRKEDLKKKYSTKFDEEDLEFILNISDLKDFNHKYTDFILKVLDPNSDIDMSVDVALDLIKDFDKYQSQLKKKDINQYKSFSELEDALKPFHEKEKEKELEKQVDKIYEDDKFLVVKPKTEESSCKYGSNTRWCVTQKGGGHFERYTMGTQGLYFIINKTNSTNKSYSKVAIHFNDEGDARYWDSQDSQMSQREIDVLNYAFPEIIESINKDYEKFRLNASDDRLSHIFDFMGETSFERNNYLDSNFNLYVTIRGFQNQPNLGFGHALGKLTVSLSSKIETKSIDSYTVYITYKNLNKKSFTVSVGFEGNDEIASEDFEDLGLENWGIDVIYNFLNSSELTAEGVRRHITSRVSDHISTNPKLVRKVVGKTKIWKPVSVGYKFNQNKGMIKKLVDYLDSGYDNGTKLDFLEYVGKLKSKVENGKKLYSHSSGNQWLPSVNWRGQFGTFFSAAKQAGIIQYKKVGNKFIIKKGPNFDAFKTGELRAL